MLLAELVAESEVVAGARARRKKIDTLAGLLARLNPAEVPAAVGFLAGDPRQGRVGVGWTTLVGLASQPATEPSLTVADLDRVLTRIQQTTGSGSTAERSRVLADLFAQLTQPEQDFVRRLLAGELRQGALEGVVTEAVAKAAGVPGEPVRRALMLSGDLGRTAEIALREGLAGLRAVGPEVFRPIQPMLASTADDLEEALAEAGPASVEWKLDGVRIQVHRKGTEVRIFTRNLNEVTPRLPEVVEVVRRLPARQVVLDGEVILEGPDGRPHPFQETMARVARQRADPSLRVAPYFFDCLHLDREDLIDRPLAVRLAALERAVGERRMPSITTADAEEARRFLQDALARGHEGVMVKALDSPYQAGRRGRAWRKVKPARTFDLVVLAAEWGHGRRRGRLSNLHLGARDPEARSFVMVGKTFKGLTDELLAWQTRELLARESHRVGIAVFVRPELVAEVELDGVQVSPRYPGGIALRFARLKRYRPDKRPEEADTIDDLRALLPDRPPS